MMIGTKETMPEKEFIDYAMQLQNGPNAINTALTKLVYTSPTPMHDLGKIADHMKILIDLMARNANARVNSLIADIRLSRDRIADLENENANTMFDLRKEMHGSPE